MQVYFIIILAETSGSSARNHLAPGGERLFSGFLKNVPILGQIFEYYHCHLLAKDSSVTTAIYWQMIQA